MGEHSSTLLVTFMKLLKRFYSVYFLICSLICVPVPLKIILDQLVGNPVDKRLVDGYVDMRVVYLLLTLGVVFSIGCYVAWRESTSKHVRGRSWVLFASALNPIAFLISCLMDIYLKHGLASWGSIVIFGIPAAIGIVGLRVFSLKNSRGHQRRA